MAIRETNSEALEKITTDDFSAGGTLSPERFDVFFRAVKENSEVLDRARGVSVSAESGDIPRLDVGERLLRPVGEGEEAPLSDIQQPSVPYQTQKLALAREFSWESIHQTIDDPQRAIAEMFISLYSRDLERLAFTGDTSSSDPFDSSIDGWLTQAQASSSVRTHDHAEDNTSDSTDNPTPQPIDKSLFGNMKMTMPRRYREKDNLAFLVSSDQLLAYKQWLTERNTAAGDQMLMTQEEPSAYGTRILTPLGFPQNVAMLTNMDNLAYVVQDKLRVEHAEKGRDMVLQDIEEVTNILSKIDYELLEEAGIVLGTNIEAPTA
jgi:hypothetical protein